MKVLVMGLGLNGGGLEAACYLHRHGAHITVTDLRDEKTLSPSIEKLDARCAGRPVHYVLGRHETGNFEKADIVIKNPGVRPDSPYLKAARRIETDISLFLNAAPARITAVTGSKGKSFTSSALYHCLEKNRQSGKAFLGGNITVSPLSFLDGLCPEDDVVLELSSWQLGDLRGRTGDNGNALLKPKVAVLTSILPDHQDFYGSMEPYVADKRVIYEGQSPDDVTVAPCDDEWGKSFLSQSRAAALAMSLLPPEPGINGGWLENPEGSGFARLAGKIGDGFFDGGTAQIVPADPLSKGRHQKRNMLCAGLALLALGLKAQDILEGLGSFPGIEHRMELFHKAGRIDFYNDSAATIPEAAAAAVETLGGEKTVLVTGGTDKKLDFSPLAKAAANAKAVLLLQGSGSEKLASMLRQAGTSYLGPFGDIDDAVRAALENAAGGDSVVLSPGCASFGMFLNEFDRGRKWKAAVMKLAQADFGY